MTIKLNVVDAGARYGIHPTLEELKEIATFHLFEIDPSEALILSEKYKSFKNINVHNLALHSTKSTHKVNLRHHLGLSSLLDVDELVFKHSNYMKEESEVIKVVQIESVTVDEFLSDEVHFIKCDTEGTELDVLKGAIRHINNNTIGVRAEVRFRPFYKEQTYFNELNSLLLDCGFELINLGYDGRGIQRSKFTLPDRYGVIAGCDAVWCKDKLRLLDTSLYTDDEIQANIIRAAVFYMLNNATDCAIDMLIHSVDCLGLTFKQHINDPVFIHLTNQVEKLFYYLVRSPYFERKELDSLFQRIFHKTMRMGFYQ